MIIRKPNYFVKSNQKKGPLANEDITTSSLRLIDDKGQNLGVLSLQKAKEAAVRVSLDLIIVSPESSPPVARLLDMGKYKYELQKKRNQSKSNQKTVSLKEVKLRPSIDNHDYEVKLKAIRKFISSGDRVKITIRFRGRELSNTQPGLDLINKVIAATEDIAQLDQSTQFEGRQFIAVLGKKSS